jgi:uncharacterized membrane protein
MRTLGSMLAALDFLRFESPGYLALLALLPLLVLLSFRSLSGLGPIRRWLAIAARCLVVGCMVLALAGAQCARKNDNLSVIFLIDRSNSIPRELQQKAFEFVSKSTGARRPDDRVGVIAFDGAAAVEQLPMNKLALERVTAPVEPDQTDLAAATRLATALMPSNTARRMVLISDGNENVGDVLEEARRVGTAGIPIDVVPIQYEHANEIVFEQLKAPPTANAEETINLQMILRSQQPATGKILLWHNEQLVDLDEKGPGAGYPVSLNTGPNRYVIPVPLRVAGAHRFRAEFQPDNSPDDTVVDNNEGRAFTVVSGQGKILILTTEADLKEEAPSALLLKQALERERLVCDVEVAGENPIDQVRLLEYSLVIVSNVPAGDFRDEEKQAMAVYVRELGGGLAMIGGDESFGAGGWMGSAVEDVMPVSFEVKNTKQIPKGALCLVMHACEIPQGNYWGERVAVESVKTLSSRDLVGVLAWQWFGADKGYWVVPLQEVGNKTAVVQQIMKMSMGDLPDLDPLMRDGVNALIARKDAAAKHMIVISDFDPQAPRSDLIDTMKKNGITCSTVAIGYGGHWIDEGRARDIATSTGGKFYRTDDFSKLPQIFIKEATIVRRSLVSEQTFTPRVRDAFSPVIAGLTGEGIPDLGGMVLTTPKPLASVPLIRKAEDGDDPLLAHWQVGLGKTVAFTSGMWNRWGAAWVGWPRFSKLWAQVARWASRQSESAAFDVTTTIQGGKAKLQIDALDKNASAVNFMDMRGALVTPGQKSEPLRLTQTGPGRYEAEFDARDRGNYIVSLQYNMGQGRDAISGTLRTGISVAYSPEYSRLEPNLPLLDEVKARSNGRIIDGADTKAAFDRAGLQRAEARNSIWEDLVRLMLVLFLLDVAIRRIAINPIEVARKARKFLSEIARGRQPAAEAAAVLTTLKSARERVREEKLEPAAEVPEAGTPPARAARYEAPASAAKAAEDLGRALGGATQQDAPVVARPTGKKPAVTEAEYTSRLLRAKRRAQEELKEDDEAKP